MRTGILSSNTYMDLVGDSYIIKQKQKLQKLKIVRIYIDLNYVFLVNKCLFSLLFSKFPLNVGSGRLRLKKPNLHKKYDNNSRRSIPPAIEMKYTHHGIFVSPVLSRSSGYARVSTWIWKCVLFCYMMKKTGLNLDKLTKTKK